MLKSVLLYAAITSWTLGMMLLMGSNASVLMKQTGCTRSRRKKYRMGYSVGEMKKVLVTTTDETIRRKLKQKIRLRRIMWLMFVLTPLFIFLALLFGE